MRLLVDENVDVKVIGLLRRLGHEAIRTPAGTKNGTVMRLAIQERRVLVTRDSDFADSTRFPPSRCPGIIHLDIHPPRFDRIAPALKSFLAAVAEENIAGKLFVLGEDGYDEFT